MAGGAWFPIFVVAFSGMLVLLDYGTGPHVHVHLLLVVPVALLAWRTRRAALFLAIVLCGARTLLELFVWHRHLEHSVLATNALIHLLTLILVALVVAGLARRARLFAARWIRTIECLPVGVLSTDAGGHVHYANDMARRMGMSLESSSFGPLAKATLLSEAALESALVRGTTTLNREVELSTGSGEKRVLRTSTSPVTDERGEVTGAVVIHEDITDRKALEREREGLTLKLSRALADVKVLKGLLPMCAACGKVRDASGQWERVDTYLATHSELEVSHSLCGDCAHELYPDYVSRSEEDERP
jgi:PAS domain S-box-containing protein